MPDAVEPLVEYFRCICGEHPDWDEYREAMRAQNKSLIRITIERWGPVRDRRLPARLRRLSCSTQNLRSSASAPARSASTSATPRSSRSSPTPCPAYT